MNRSHLKECDMTTDGLVKFIKGRETGQATAKQSLNQLKEIRSLKEMGETDAIAEIAKHAE